MLPEWWSYCHIDDPKIKTMADYNNLLTSEAFWSKFDKFDRVLIFQHDSMLLRPDIEDYLEWDFIGAPIKHIDRCMNGGLSLRNPAKMLEVIRSTPYRGMAVDGNEDIYFVNRLRELNANLPSVEVASSFSVETIFHPDPLGYHAMDKYLSSDQCNQILNAKSKTIIHSA